MGLVAPSCANRQHAIKCISVVHGMTIAQACGSGSTMMTPEQSKSRKSWPRASLTERRGAIFLLPINHTGSFAHQGTGLNARLTIFAQNSDDQRGIRVSADTHPLG